MSSQRACSTCLRCPPPPGLVCLCMQEQIQKDIIDWLRFLKQSIGFDGWRFDFVRGYNGKFCKIYTDATVRGAVVVVVAKKDLISSCSFACGAPLADERAGVFE